MGEKVVPVEIQVKEKVSPYDEQGSLLSRIGDYNFLSEFRKINRMPRNSKVWFFVNVGGKQLLGQAVSLTSSWIVTVYDAHIKDSGMVPLAKFRAKDRFELEELMYSMYFELTKLVEEKGSENDSEELG